MGVDRRLLQHHRLGAPQAAGLGPIPGSAWNPVFGQDHAQLSTHIHRTTLATTSPNMSSTAAHTKADVKFAIWKRQNGMSKMPATSGTEARSGPKKRPMKMPAVPHFFMNASPFGISSGCRDSGQICCTVYSSFRPIQYDSQSPSAAPIDAATQIGQKLISPAEIKAPIPTRAAHAGSSREMNASDSPKASSPTIAGAQPW